MCSGSHERLWRRGRRGEQELQQRRLCVVRAIDVDDIGIDDSYEHNATHW